MYSYSGINDKSSYEVDIEDSIKKTILTAFKSFGFQQIDLSSVEQSELFLKKIGDRIKSEMIIFKDHQNKEFCLRPEITSSTLRYYFNHLQNEIHPIKLCYSGKVFRNGWGENPSIREITHIGAEVIDIDHEYYGAENIVLAWNCITQLGLSDYKIVIGNVGVIRDLVDRLDLDSAFKNFFLENIKNKDTDKDFFLKAIEEDIHPSEDNSDYKDLVEILKKLTAEEEKVLLKKLLHYVHPHFSKELDEAEDIIEGILEKIKREKQFGLIHKIVDFSKEFQRVQGKPLEAIAEAENVIQNYSVETKHLDELKKQIYFLQDYGVPLDKVHVDFSLGRNLQYYTGMVFEIEGFENSKLFPICGGGRYDNLIETQSKKVSGTGFAFYLDEIIKLILEKSNTLKEPAKADFYIYASQPELVQLSKSLRGKGYKVFTVFSSNNNDIDLKYFQYIVKLDKNSNYSITESKTGKTEILQLDEIHNRFQSV